MYEWARLHGGAGTENLGTWCMSEDKREAMKLLGCDEKYDNEKTIYMILESEGKCVDGDFEFEYN